MGVASNKALKRVVRERHRFWSAPRSGTSARAFGTCLPIDTGWVALPNTLRVERWAGASRKLNDFWLVHHELSSEIVPAFEPDVRDPASFDSTTDMDEPTRYDRA